MTALLILSTTDTKGPTHRNDQVKGTGHEGKGERGKRVSSQSPSQPGIYVVCKWNLDNRDGRTFGGRPLMTGINRIYKKRATVKRPENTERPTKGLVRREEE
jgi:hypothetical protein